MYDELIKRLHRYSENCVAYKLDADFADAVQQAADAIKTLEIKNTLYKGNLALANKLAETRKAIIDKIMNRQKWISVTERLPLDGQDVLAVRTYGDGEKCQEVLMAHIVIGNEETGKKWWNATNITHWMPLPEPPMEEREDADN